MMRSKWLLILLILAGGSLSAAEKPNLEVASDPPGASLFINGQLAGVTPIAFKNAPKGAYRLRLEKKGFVPRTIRVEVGEKGSTLKETLESLPTGRIQISVEPRGAEIVLDGEVAGHTPLLLDHVLAGVHELRIEKSNFDSYSRTLSLHAGEILTYSGFSLKDRTYANLDSLMKSEPQRVSNYLDFAQYLFVNGRKDEAGVILRKGMEVLNQPLDFNGPGYPGGQQMTARGIQLEQETREEDAQKFLGFLKANAQYQNLLQSEH